MTALRTVRLEVSMREVLPPVVRVLDVPAGATLPELHQLLQAALGWTDSHLHQFTSGTSRWGQMLDDGWDAELRDETTATLADLGERFDYAYDFGDGWEHDVAVVGRGGDRVGCVSGSGACPPEDVGGPHGYAELIASLADPRHPEHARSAAWAAGTFTPFDLAETDRQVRRLAGTVPESVGLLLGLCRGGVKLTPGGRLPRVVVRAMQEHRPHWAFWGKPARVEEDLLPLMVLHDLVRKAGLLTLRQGTLRPSAAAGDHRETVARLRGLFPAGEFTTLLADEVIAELCAYGPATTVDLAARIHPRLGPGWSDGDGPLSRDGVRWEIDRLGHTLSALDQIVETEDGPYPRPWSAGPAAPTLLTGSAVLTRYAEHAAAPA